ncbi:MAG: phage tail protein [Dokdonella sp.]
MSNPFIGEIRMVGFNFPPAGWAACNGQVLSIAQNDALFALIGTTYGGDGVTTFGLPDLRGRLPLHQGTGVGLSGYTIGQSGGTETVTLLAQDMPIHQHALNAARDGTRTNSPAGNMLGSGEADVYTHDTGNPVQMAPQEVGPAGGSQPHPNMHPFLCINFVISLYGIFPSRN